MIFLQATGHHCVHTCNWRMGVKGLEPFLDLWNRSWGCSRHDWVINYLKRTNTNNRIGHEKGNTHPCWSWPRLVWFVSLGCDREETGLWGEPRSAILYLWQCVIQIGETWVTQAPIQEPRLLLKSGPTSCRWASRSSIIKVSLSKQCWNVWYDAKYLSWNDSDCL